VLVLAASATFAVSLAILVGLIYLVVLRLVDLNEKEPFWALGLALGVGAVAGVLLPAFVDSSTLVLEPFTGALAEGIALFLALAVVLVAFEGIGRMRGWSEVNGLLDGVVYGAAVGLGFAAGSALVSNLRYGALDELLGTSAFDTLWTAVLAGLASGLFGALIGAGFGAAFESGDVERQIGFPVAGLAGAIVTSWLYTLAFEGSVLRAWLGLLLPVAIVAALVVYALTRERRALESELVSELAEEDLRLLASPRARRSRYTKMVLAGDLDGWAAARALHNRAMQLALVKRRLSRMEGDRREAAEIEAARLRAAIAELRGATR
jgi:protease PrsW